jgi:GR25 family glycosyltransferase involved in LPS biosynthesis
MVHAYCINLATQPARKAHLEANFAEYMGQLPLHRIEAVTAAECATVPGRLRPGEKGCLRSHIVALEQAMQHEGPALIIEDDVMFGPSSLNLLLSGLVHLNGTDWDLLYTDLCIPNIPTMLKLYKYYQDYRRDGALTMFDPTPFSFATSAAYVVSAAGKARLLGKLRALDELNVPYDLLLRHWVHEGQLGAQAIIPFVTTLSPLGDDSDIQALDKEATDIAWIAFRRLIWVDAHKGLIDPTAALSRVPPSYVDDSAAHFGEVLKLMLSANYQDK